jgi:hypothetical protein
MFFNSIADVGAVKKNLLLTTTEVIIQKTVDGPLEKNRLKTESLISFLNIKGKNTRSLSCLKF